MPEPVPSESQHEQTFLRDHLAIDRTTLANERTLLGYVRTALALTVVGASALRFFDSPAYVALGWGFMGTGLLTVLVGLGRFWQMNRRIAASSLRNGLGE